MQILAFPLPAATSPDTRQPWTGSFRAVAGIAVLAVGLTAIGGAGWTMATARQSVHGQLVAFATSPPHARPADLVGNTP